MSRRKRDKLADALIKMSKNTKEAAYMSDAALFDRILEELWGKMKITSPHFAYLGELLRRFQERSGGESEREDT